MLRRKVYRAQLKSDKLWIDIAELKNYYYQVEKLKNEGKIMTLSLFRLEQNLFLYYECIGENLEPEEFFGKRKELLRSWPGEEEDREWIPMIDIYHNHEPQSVQSWERKQEVEKVIGKVGRLQSDKVSSYIFYHYQLQEERPGKSHKYGIITMHENLLFFYKEYPFYIEPALHTGKLETNNTPSQWGELMETHFIKCKEGSGEESIWQDAEIIMSTVYKN